MTDRIQVSQLEGPLLDFWVARALDMKFRYPWCFDGTQTDPQPFAVNWMTEKAWGLGDWEPSTNWAQGGGVIEHAKIKLYPSIHEGFWDAYIEPWTVGGATPLVAAMRAFVASKYGADVESPAWLKP